MNRRVFTKALLTASIAFAPFACVTLQAAEEPVPQNEKNLSFRNELRGAIDRGLAYLKSKQNADGSFGEDVTHPALSALPLVAFQRQPTREYVTSDVTKKGYAYLRTFAQPDGGIYNPANGLANYNTSVSLLALFGAGDAADKDLLLKARAYVVGQQASGMAKAETDGGIGYGTVGASPKRGHPDLDNTLIALEALAATKSLVADNPNVKDLNWKAAIEFISRTQNLPETNKGAWVSGDEANKGGFIYYPGSSNAGEMDLPGGGKALRSYGSMSYAGLLSFIYADLPKDDVRVKAALEWLQKHYTLEENPGLEKQGYYYFLHLMAKALSAADVKELEVSGKKVDWRRELGVKLLSLQKADGTWQNEVGRWKENNPVLTTTYCVMALEILYHQL